MIEQEQHSREHTPLPFEFTEKPARFERIRLAIARDIFCRRAYFTRFSLWLVPDSHPWKLVTNSAHEDWREMTYATLRPRINGQVQPELDKPINGQKGFTALWLFLALFLVYAVVSRLVEDLPSIIPVFTSNTIWD